jgi:hypothetical protein
MAKRVFTSNGRTASCRCVNEIKRTIPGLAMTPSQVAEMAASEAYQQCYERHIP